MNRREILKRHRTSLNGSLHSFKLPSRALGIKKPFYVYEPPGLNSGIAVPTLYLFRGHEREWVNIEEDSSRSRSTGIEDIDTAISNGLIPPVLVVLPGLNSANNHIPSLGINMIGNWPAGQRGLGSGKFWNFLDEELFPHITKQYPAASGACLAAGFSLGGYTASLLATNNPGRFKHIGIYDGLFMWPDHFDPRQDPNEDGNDSVWMKGQLFDPALGSPRNVGTLNGWNPTNKLVRAAGAYLDQLRDTTWWISCAVSDGQFGNRDRAEYYCDLLRRKQIPLGFTEVLFDEHASHAWHWADKFVISFLIQSLAP